MALVDMKTSTITGKGQIVIPKDLRSEAFSEGSKVAILSYDDHIEIRPLKELDDKLYTMYASQDALGEYWNTKEEEEAWKDL
jgi:AbrB family looped-hinge helix DNA binding protein